MMASAPSAPMQVPILATKLYDGDPDIRYMSLIDLQAIFAGSDASFLATDYPLCVKVVDGFLHTLNDTNSEVQNLAVKSLGSFCHKAHPDILCPMVHKIGNLSNDSSIDNSIAAMGLRAVVVAFPKPSPSAARTKAVQDAYHAISKVLIPRLVGSITMRLENGARPAPATGLLQEDLEKGTDSTSMDVLTEVARCFGPMLHVAEVEALQTITTQFLESDRTGSVMKKKAITALSMLAHYFTPDQLTSLLSHMTESLGNPHLAPASLKFYMVALGSIARAIPKKFGPHLTTLAPFVLSALNQPDLDENMQGLEENDSGDSQVDEVREAALVTLEAFLSCCPDDMQKFNEECISTTLRFLKYDPNVAEEEDAMASPSRDNDADDEYDLDEDFEEEGVLDDEDDTSWKLRRCAVKVMHTIVSVRGRDLLESADTYDRLARALIARFKEREENIRLEILLTLAFLIRRTGEEYAHHEPNITTDLENSLMIQPRSRKRRRGDSDASMRDGVKHQRLTGSTSPDSESAPRAAPLMYLAKIAPAVTRGALQLFKTSTIATKQASLTLLKEVVIARHGGLSESLDNLVDPLIDTIRSSSTEIRPAAGALFLGSSSANANNLQIEALQLLAEVAKAHSSMEVQPHMTKVISAVLEAAKGKTSRISCEALKTAEQLVKLLTPPRSASNTQGSSDQLRTLLKTLLELITSKNTDLSVRHQAIHVLGVLLGRTLGSRGTDMITTAKKAESFEVLYEAMKNETTRFASIKAVNAIASMAKGDGFNSVWLSKICLELGAQLRKADRSLRGASLEALRHLLAVEDGHGTLDPSSSQQLAALLIPLLAGNDLHLLSPALLILAAMVTSSTTNIVDDNLNKHICVLVTNGTAASVLDPLCRLVQSIGLRGIGQPLMQALLKSVGAHGSPAIVGKVIGALLVAGGPKIGVKVDDFLKEVNMTIDGRRKCLALAILGEVGLRSGSSSPLSPDLFLSHFTSSTDEVPLTAAIALGRASAGSGNVATYVPAILSRIKQRPGEEYLALHSIKELLRHNETEAEILPFSDALWKATVATSRAEDNRTIRAECVANLVVLDSRKYLPLLQQLLNDQLATTRGTAILALRDVFTVTDASYDQDLRLIIVDVLSSMLKDCDLENRRSALNTFNAAARNKFGLILPHLATLLPLVIDQTYEDQSLIREVSMGPFKHKVDDGLEVRKSAYETLYSIMEIAPTRVDIVKVYDRVVAGIKDDHDIRTLCNLMLTKLAVLAPEETARRLDDIADQFSGVLNQKLKETSVRLEHEKADEAKKGVIRVALELHRAFPADGGGGGSGPASTLKWSDMLDHIRKEHGVLMKEAEKEMKEKERS